jgi:hypothetical protein
MSESEPGIGGIGTQPDLNGDPVELVAQWTTDGPGNSVHSLAPRCTATQAGGKQIHCDG